MAENGQQELESMRIAVIGNCRAGKSSIIRRFTDNTFSEDYVGTVGVDFDSRSMDVEGRLVRISLLDTSGNEGFLGFGTKSIRQADAFVFVYDITDADSFNAVESWLRIVNRNAKGPHLPKMLVGNKIDLHHRKEVSEATAKEFGIPEGLVHVEISAKTGKNLQAALHKLASKVLRYRILGGGKTIATQDFILEGPDLYDEDDSEAVVLPDSPEYTHLFRILLLGPERVGKTALRYRFCRDFYCPQYYATPGFDFDTKSAMIDGEKVKIQIWDASGADVHEQTRRGYYKGANGFIIVYDITSKKSFKLAEKLIKEVSMESNEAPPSPKILIGNKADLAGRRAVDFVDAKEFADGWRIPVTEVSARNGSSVQEAFMKLAIALKRQCSPWKKIYDFS